MRIYLAGENQKSRIILQCASISQGKTVKEESLESMKVYLAGEHCVKNGKEYVGGGLQPYILETFYYARKNPQLKELLPLYGDLLLDSGAFTFKRDAKGGTHLDWRKYCREYADFIKENKIEKYFELDIDDIVGLPVVEDLRKELEDRTGIPSIPVWHPKRGYEYYLKNLEEYKYVAYGAFITDNVPMSVNEKVLPTFINEAHKRGVKIHGLGYTCIEGLKRFPFDSVDSTAWLYGNRGGFLYIFNPEKGNFDKVEKQQGKRLNAQAGAEHNFLEWIKFQKYAERNL